MMRLRVMTYNILNGGAGREDAILTVIKAQQPDVVVLQEVASPALIERFAAELEMQSYFALANTIIARDGWKISFLRRNIELLSRFPITYQNSYHPFPLWRTLLEARIEYAPNQSLTVFGVHLKADLSVLAEVWRTQEIARILNRIKSHAAEKYVVVGDFNSIAPGDRVDKARFPRWLKTVVALQGGRVYHFALARMLTAGVADCYRTLQPINDGFTLPPPTPNTRLDYIFASPALASGLKNCEVVRVPLEVERASDHYPVVAEFEV